MQLHKTPGRNSHHFGNFSDAVLSIKSDLIIHDVCIPPPSSLLVWSITLFGNLNSVLQGNPMQCLMEYRAVASAESHGGIQLGISCIFACNCALCYSISPLLQLKNDFVRVLLVAMRQLANVCYPWVPANIISSSPWDVANCVIWYYGSQYRLWKTLWRLYQNVRQLDFLIKCAE